MQCLQAVEDHRCPRAATGMGWVGSVVHVLKGALDKGWGLEEKSQVIDLFEKQRKNGSQHFTCTITKTIFIIFNHIQLPENIVINPVTTSVKASSQDMILKNPLKNTVCFLFLPEIDF